MTDQVSQKTETCPSCLEEILRKSFVRHVRNCRGNGQPRLSAKCRKVLTEDSGDRRSEPPKSADDSVQVEVVVEWDHPTTAELEDLSTRILKRVTNFTEEHLLEFAAREIPAMSEGAARCLVIGAVAGARLASLYHHYWRDNVRNHGRGPRRNASVAAGELSRWSMGFHGDFIQHQDDGELSVTDEDQSPTPDRPFQSDTMERTQIESVVMPTVPQQPLRERGSGPSLDIFPVSFERAAAQLMDDFSAAANQPVLTTNIQHLQLRS